jgi:1-aminocyclopropane-1-carboxylate deaminase
VGSEQATAAAPPRPRHVVEGPAAAAALHLRLPSPVQELCDDRLARHGVRVYLKRDDLIHPELAGNKWRKLHHNLTAAAEQGHRRLLTFGGAWSNHLRATAAAGHHLGFSTIGVIRGEEHLPLNPTLADAASRGMRLVYLDRATYRVKHTPEVLGALHARFGDFYLLPEGGSNELGVRGCAELPAELDVGFDVICCACGTGGTLAGIAAGLHAGQRAIGFSALKGGRFLVGEVAELQRRTFGGARGDWTVECDFHFGGFARRTPQLDGFVRAFGARHGLALEPVYVAKMLYGVYELAARGRFTPGTTVVAVVTG